jgi:predicted nucleic acid-binding protein
VTVYVESNFVLERALQQEQSDSCSQIMHLASKGSIRLVVPAFALAEPHDAISRKEAARSRLSSDLRSHLTELGRSKPHRAIPASFDALAEILISNARQEREGLRSTVSELLRHADVIALDAPVLKSAEEIQVQYELSGQDSIVLASVLAHLDQAKPAESCFLNRNAKDFGDPSIRESLEARGCKFLGSFDEGLRYITSRIRI